MPDIFLSYARMDEIEHQRARLIAEALEAVGYSVFWDAKIPAGRDYIEFLEQQLDDASCVIVLWSDRSRKSFWVREEASSGRDRGILIPISLSDVLPPLGFRSIQTISFGAWSGTQQEDCWKQLIVSIGRLLPGKITPRAARVTSATPWHIVLALDDSGSMNGPVAKMINESINYMLTEMQLLSPGTKPYFYLSAITYGDEAESSSKR